MLLVGTVLLLVVAVAVAVRWVLLRVDALGRPRPFPAVGVVALLVASGVLAVPVVNRSRLEHRLSDVASVLAGRPVTVDCASGGAGLVDVDQHAGHVDVGPDGRPVATTVLDDAVCDDVASWVLHRDRTGGRPDVDGATAVHVLTHESMHLRGVLDEAAAECAAVQRDAYAARLLGADDDAARRLARTYWLVVYPRMQEPYRTAECAAGQRLDEGGPDAPWLAGNG